MAQGIGSICFLVLLHGLISGFSEGLSGVQVVVDGYTRNTALTSGDSVLIGTQIILVCYVVGLPYGTPLGYTWICPNGPCEVEGYYGRKVYNEHILAVNTTSVSDGGTYTCQVTATGGQEATGNFTLSVNGADVVHTYGRLIPHEFPITDLQQIFGPDGIGRINCSVSSGKAKFIANGGQLETGGVSQTRNGAKATLVVNSDNVDSFRNMDIYCTDININFFYLVISNANPLSVPTLTVNRATNSAVKYMYDVLRGDDITTAVITGYEVTRFGVPMIGEYVNTGRGRTVTISPAVPGARYRITAWALGGGNRSTTPAVVEATTGEAGPSSPRNPSITRQLQDGIELNWLPPTEPNGEVNYVIYYTPEGGTEQSIDTGSDLTHCNLTGLERNRMYTNIAVQAVNSAGMSERSAKIAHYNHTPPDAPSTSSPPATRSPGTNDPGTTSTEPPGGASIADTQGTVSYKLPGPSPGPPSITDIPSTGSHASPGSSSTTGLIAGVMVTLLVVVLLSLVGGVVAVVVKVRKRKMKEIGQSHSKAYLEGSVHDKDSINMYQNVQSQPNPAPGHSDPYYSTPADNFANPASATASFGGPMYDTADYSEVDQRALDINEGGLYEDASAEATWGGGGYNEKPVKGASGAQKISAVLTKTGYELMNPEELYTQPDKSAKAKKDIQGSKNDEENAAPVEDLYTVPDMTKKKQRNQQQLEQKNEEGSLPPQAPLSYKKHKEAKHDIEGKEEDAPEPPPPYVPDEEQHCDTRDGNGPSSQERRFEYAELDWQEK